MSGRTEDIQTKILYLKCTYFLVARNPCVELILNKVFGAWIAKLRVLLNFIYTDYWLFRLGKGLKCPAWSRNGRKVTVKLRRKVLVLKCKSIRKLFFFVIIA